MKTIVKLLIATVVINAAARAGIVTMRYYQLREAAQQTVLFGADASPEDLRDRILQQAQALKVPVRPENVLVKRQGGRTWADASYRQSVEYFPNQEYPMDLSFSVEAYAMVLAPPPARRD